MPRLLSLSVIASLLFFAVPVQAQDLLRWETDLASAQKQAAATNRLVLIHFWGTWCPPCMEMENTVFNQPGLGNAILPYYVPVKIRVEEGMNQDLAKQFQVDGYPCDIVMTAQGEIVSKSKGKKPADKYVAMCNQAAQQALAQARSNGLPPVATAQVTAPAVAAAPTAAAPTSPDAGRYAAVAPTDNRYAAYAPPVAAQAAPVATTPAAAPAAAASRADDRYAAYYQSRGLAAPAAPVASAPVAPAAAAPGALTVTAPPAAGAAAPALTTTSTVGDRYAASAPVATTPAAAPRAPVAATPPAVSAPVAAAAPVVTNAVVTTVTPNPVAATPAPAAAPAAPTTTVAPAAPPASAVTSTAVGTGANAPPKSPLEALIPAGSPPLALEGYCPVTVIEKMVWTKGNPLYGAIHLGRTYLFPTAEQQAKFLANPERYSPIISGNDPVVALEKNEIVSGRRQFGLVYENRMILFSSKDSYDKFCKESKRYSTELQQALQSSNAIRR